MKEGDLVMENGTSEDRMTTTGEGEFERYTNSWVDSLTNWVDRLPGPSWAYYLGLYLVLFLLQVMALWIEGLFPSGGIDPAHIFLAGAIPYMLALIYYFDQRASTALASMRPAMTTSDKEFEELDYRLTTLPARATILAGLVGLSCIFLLESISGEPYYLETVVAFPISQILFRILYLILWWVFGTLVFHTFQQLRMIDRIYTEYTRINLFQLKTLYAFSNLTALTAVCMALLPVGFLLANPWLIWTDPVVFGVVLTVQVIALVTFIWPQLGIHRLQVAEKERLLEEANQRFEAMIAALHQQVDAGKLEDAMNMNMTISSLQAELKTIEDIPTWPWRPETLRLLISALALPLGLWFVQLLLQRVLVP
jgi:hypothetical protein